MSSRKNPYSHDRVPYEGIASSAKKYLKRATGLEHYERTHVAKDDRFLRDSK